MSPGRDGHDLSFKEFCDTKNITPRLRKGFKTHVRLYLGNFTFRSWSQWETHYASFATADRSRRRAL